MRTGGIILCGGHSRRMGRTKAALPFGDELLIQRIVRIVASAVGPVVVVAAAGQELPPLPAEIRIVVDELPDRGPLGGLAAGLAALEGAADEVYLSACDVPFLTPAFIARVLALRGDAVACVPKVGGHLHPLAAAFSVAVLPAVRRLLARGELRAHALFDEVATRSVGPDDLAGVDPGLRSLRNVNTPAEYAAALREAGLLGAAGDPVQGA